MAHQPGHGQNAGTNTNVGNPQGSGPGPMGGGAFTVSSSALFGTDPVSNPMQDAWNIWQGQQPVQQTSWMGLAAGAVPALGATVISGIQYSKAKTDAKNQQNLVDNLMSQYMSKPIRNPYANMPVATKAAEMKAEETDQVLANTLDTMRETGYGAGGATALARAAANSKQGIASDIEKQEARNAQLAAKGEMMVQQAEFSRLDQQMDYEQSKADLSNQRMVEGMEGLAGGLGSLGALGVQAGTYTTTKEDLDNNKRRFF